MSYYDQSLLAWDDEFSSRVTSSVATQATDIDPSRWAMDHRFHVAAAPGFADKYASALAGDVPNPGRDASVISDNDILAAVQAILAREA